MDLSSPGVDRFRRLAEGASVVNTMLRRDGGYALSLLAIAAFAFGRNYAPNLHSDDWGVIYWNYLEQPWIEWSRPRLFLKIGVRAVYSIFGLNIAAFHAALWMLVLGASILFYFVLARLLPDMRALAFAGAALNLVYPADFTHMWIIMIGIRLAVVLAMAYALFLLKYTDSGHSSYLLIAVACLLFSLGIYEIQFGAAMLWPIVLALRSHRPAALRRRALVSVSLAGSLFVLWRGVGFRLLVDQGSEDMAGVSIAPGTLLEQLSRGYKVMVLAWLEPLQHCFGLGRYAVAALLTSAVGLAMVIAGLVTAVSERGRGSASSLADPLATTRSTLAATALGGVLFVAAGYVPIVTTTAPRLTNLSSRFNIMAQFGSATACAAVLALLLTLLFRNRRRMAAILVSAVTPLILLGIATHSQVRADDRLSWHEQRRLWRQVFVLLPDLDPTTIVSFIGVGRPEPAPSLNRNARRPILIYDWEVTSAINVLYDAEDLGGAIFDHGEYTESGLERASFLPPREIADTFAQDPLPWKQLLVLSYDRSVERLHVVEPSELGALLGFSPHEYDPGQRVRDVAPRREPPFRRLVKIPSED